MRVYREARDGADVPASIRRIMGRPGKGLSLVGLHTLTDDLDPAEIAALAALIGGWRDRPVLRLTLDALWPLWATDDLVLDGGVLARVLLRRVPGRD